MVTALVTGACGFIAKYIVRELFGNHSTVTASVRSRRRRDQLAALFPDAQLGFASMDLLKDDGWSEALEGVTVLVHTTSPFASC